MLGGDTISADVTDSVLQHLLQQPDFAQQLPAAEHLSQHEDLAFLQQPKIVLKNAVSGHSPILHSRFTDPVLSGVFGSDSKLITRVPYSRIPLTGAYWVKNRRSGLIGWNCGLITTCDTASACWASTLLGAA